MNKVVGLCLILLTLSPGRITLHTFAFSAEESRLS